MTEVHSSSEEAATPVGDIGEPNQRPAWLSLLDEAMAWSPHGERWWSPTYEVDIVTASLELRGWLNDHRKFHGQHKNGWISTLEDFKHATELLGGELGRILKSEVDNLRSWSQGFPGNLQVGVPASTSAASAVKGIEDLLALLATPHAVGAAWRDLVVACQADKPLYESIARKRDNFWRVATLADYNRYLLSQMASNILAAKAAYVLQAKVDLREEAPPSAGNWPDHRATCELDLPGRLALCERWLTSPPKPAHHVVWFSIARARAQEMVLEVGPVTFYWADLISSVLDNPGQNDSWLPPELINEASFFTPTTILSDEQDLTLARVDLGVIATHNAARLAREKVEAAVGVARFYSGVNDNWEMMQGRMLAVDGRIIGHSAFRGDSDRIRLSVNVDGTGERLADLSPKLGPRLIATDQESIETFSALKWWHEADNRGRAAALVLHVRIVELYSSRMQVNGWYKYLDEYYRTPWIEFAMRAEIEDTVYAACNASALPSKREKIEEIARRLYTFKTTSVNWRLADLIDAVPELVEIWPAHTVIGQHLRSLSERLDTPTKFRQWHAERSNTWSLLRQRIRRVRNSLAHGGPVTDQAVELTAPHARQLAGWVVSEAIRAVMDNRSLSDQHLQIKVRNEEWERRALEALDGRSALAPA